VRSCGLTCDVSGGLQAAKPAGGHSLDGGVRRHVDCAPANLTCPTDAGAATATSSTSSPGASAAWKQARCGQCSGFGPIHSFQRMSNALRFEMSVSMTCKDSKCARSEPVMTRWTSSMCRLCAAWAAKSALRSVAVATVQTKSRYATAGLRPVALPDQRLICMTGTFSGSLMTPNVRAEPRAEADGPGRA